MAIDEKAKQNFERAVLKGFVRKVMNLLTGKKDELLPFDEVRQRLPMRGQHFLGMREVPIQNIVGSMGRYLDFDRAFLPTQTRTRQRWINIEKAHLSQVSLPAVELYKMGEIYFVKDGNHRVSVARERGQLYIDALVTEIDVPVPLTRDLAVDDLQLKQEYALFIEETGITSLRPQAALDTSRTGQYARLLEHIKVHRWYLGEKRSEEVPYEEAVASWYDNVYMPLLEALEEQNLLHEFPGVSETDLYLWIMEYQAYLREMYRDDYPADENVKKEEAVRLFVEDYPVPPVKKLVHALRRAKWVDELLLQQEWAAFNEKTRLVEQRPGALVLPSKPVQYERIHEHIAAHRWYLGEQRGAEVAYEEAAASWYDRVYLPLVSIIREQNILEAFPQRSEADLYLWIIEHQWYLKAEDGEEVTIEQAAENFAEDYSPCKKK